MAAMPDDTLSVSLNPNFLNTSLVDLRTYNRNIKGIGIPIAGVTTDIFDTVRKVNPDIIVLGYDQSFDEKELEKDLESRGFKGIKVVRATEAADDLNATRRRVAKIREMGSQ